MVGTGRGAKLGVLIRGPQVLEHTRDVDTVVLDKTGTVTTGKMAVTEVIAGTGHTRETVLSYAAAVERGSEHPIARAVVAAAGDGEVAEAFTNIPGHGSRGSVDHTVVHVGNSKLMRDENYAMPKELETALRAAQSEGKTPILVAWDGAVRGVIVVTDTVKDSSAEAIRQFHELGMKVHLLTGDNRVVAEKVAADLGIDRVRAEMLPEDKVNEIRRLQESGLTVAMVGDGVNDAAALAQADLGIAMGSGTDAAIAAADITLVRSDLTSAATAISLARKTLKTIQGNLFWAFAYNAAMIPLAAFGLLNPMLAGAAMAFSSLFVVGNSLRLRRAS